MLELQSSSRPYLPPAMTEKSRLQLLTMAGTKRSSCLRRNVESSTSVLAATVRVTPLLKLIQLVSWSSLWRIKKVLVPQETDATRIRNDLVSRNSAVKQYWAAILLLGSAAQSGNQVRMLAEGKTILCLP